MNTFKLSLTTLLLGCAIYTSGQDIPKLADKAFTSKIEYSKTSSIESVKTSPIEYDKTSKIEYTKTSSIIPIKTSPIDYIVK